MFTALHILNICYTTLQKPEKGFGSFKIELLSVISYQLPVNSLWLTPRPYGLQSSVNGD